MSTNMNIATGNAQVGVQAGQIFGSVSVGSEHPASLTAELASFRELLRQAHGRGDLDDPTYAAAQAELDVATKALDEPAAGSTSKLITALKRLRGLISDVTDLAAKLATIISAVRGLV